ncbi:MAG: DNA polymerase III subunit gamma/tau [Bdellovibrionales bacterium]|nr:DNA polymerase III subunit gamma/tau [Bdellovibrionales bacterium]
MSQYQVIARKWRPQSFQDLVGQDHISTTLVNALRGDRLPQALLFTGVRGTGKTSTARILAKSLRCSNVKDYVPCGVCRDCEDIATSRAVDVVEIDGASNNGVDAIRELRDSVGYMPSSGRYKVYIIDEVHMLSTAAFNALLKTLEEPPAHVVFILATTESQKIPNTILSRCQRFDFRRIPSRQIADQLMKICSAEGVQVGPEALWSIARQADGSMRDSQSLLDQVITFSNKEITLEKVIEVLGLTDRQLVIDGTSALIRRDSGLALQLIEKVNRSGVDPKIFAQDLLEEVRNALMVRLCHDDPTRVVDLSDSEIQALTKLAGETTAEDLHTLFDMMLKGVSDLLRASDPRLVLEMTMLRVSSSPTMVSLRQLMSGAQIATMPAQGVSPRPSATAPASVGRTSSSGSVSIPVTGTISSSHASATAGPSAATPAVDTGASSATAAGGSKYTVDSFTRAVKAGAAKTTGTKSVVTALPPEPKGTNGLAPSALPNDDDDRDAPPKSSDPWLTFVYRVRKANGLLGAMLENTHVIENSADRLVLGVPKKVGFVIDKLRDPENVKRIEQFVETFWEKHLKVEVKLDDGTQDSMTPRAREERTRVEKTQSIEAAVEKNPLVRTAKNVFKTQVKTIRDSDKPSK